MTNEQVERIRAMESRELLANAESPDMGVLVEASLRLHNTTWWLNVVLIFLTAVLVALTAALVHFAAH
jgi:hypothetical protein